MKKLIGILSLVALLLMVTACGKESDSADKNKLEVVASYSVIADMVQEVGGDKVTVTSLVTRGTDPHSYEPTPQDTLAVEKADIVLSNGLNLETGKGWYQKLIENSRKEEVSFVVSEGVAPKFLTTKGEEGQEDPHAWLSLSNGQLYVENITKYLGQVDPDNQAYYEENAKNYNQTLQELYETGKEKFAQIPEKQRVLVTSEGAFKYFAEAFNLQAEFIWEINTDTQGTPEQIQRVASIIKENKVPALFIETSVSPKTMEAVSRETQTPIVSTVFTDSLAKEGEEGDTYYDMMAWNIEHISTGLLGD
ncbi:metal ABC transporter solute-binding protein, Zn/Mn family [Vagococcus zengguangii]|uniref:Metal ABC transporter substrate-binding protein n=1 Tax=Vagococcus zengguangii TaxID=2571750 RepID=A0A4D7CTW0_9ENTE|nr:zinc ABC transporter substrate-binding protein [Vagococcus zengguangii]QCI85790.1 metal ABC transporter substrate-binding protein [Vagococcus zengguangii]TLG81731.1 metal ABC transporter substrate-binding protein [Vagococcus zengguangii]